MPLIKQCHLCCLQYIAECYYSSVDECEKNWHGVCVSLEPVTEMLMSFLMSMSPSSAASFDLYAVAAAFFISGGAVVTPAVFAQDLDVGKSFCAAVTELEPFDPPNLRPARSLSDFSPELSLTNAFWLDK